MKRFKMTRRDFLKSSSFITGAAAGTSLMVGNNPELEAAPAEAAGKAERKTAIAQCPYCGVGCGTVIQTENGKIVSMRPDKDHPTNYGLQCIKGLTAAEPIYVDRMEGDPYVRKDVWEEWKKPGHGDLDFVSKTKGSFDEEHFVRVPYEESLRKNRRRFNPDKPDSILEHGLSDEKMERLYRDDDFASVAPGDSGLVEIREYQVPFVVFPNEDDVTTGKPEQLAERLESVLGKLWELSQSQA